MPVLRALILMLPFFAAGCWTLPAQESLVQSPQPEVMEEEVAARLVAEFFQEEPPPVHIWNEPLHDWLSKAFNAREFDEREIRNQSVQSAIFEQDEHDTVAEFDWGAANDSRVGFASLSLANEPLRNEGPSSTFDWDAIDVSEFGHSAHLTALDDSLAERIVEDFHNYYSPQNLSFLGVSFGIGAGIANTNFDEGIYKHFHTSVAGATSDDWGESLHAPKIFGNGIYTLPVMAVAWGLGNCFEETIVGGFAGEWGERSLRAFLVGAPPTIVMQRVTGASRPEEGNSHWHPFQDDNGVSGHAFMGSLPLITAAQIVEEPLPKFLLYAASTAVPFSRVADGDHYPAQAFLGWMMAYSAAMAVDATQDRDEQWRMIPLFGPDGSGAGLELRW